MFGIAYFSVGVAEDVWFIADSLPIAEQPRIAQTEAIEILFGW